ncbi:MAG: PEP-CTERM sorting domain-containing protein [Pirellulales bacterium]|nr:PEP-CTERM sorting domain-containing protein [Pirellulales bacterium]
MHKRFLLWAVVAGSLMLVSSPANAVLIWDTVPGDGTAITDGGAEFSEPTWDLYTPFWNDGVTPNVAWNNSAPDVAQFGEVFGTDSYFLSVDSSINVLGLVANKKYTIKSMDIGGEELVFQGTTPSITVNQQLKLYPALITDTGVESIHFRAGDTTATSTKYLYFYGANTFNAPIVIGSPAEEATGILFMPSDIDTTNGDPAGAGALGGSSSAGITVMAGSTLSFREAFFTLAKPLTIEGYGFGGRSAIQFYTIGDVVCSRELTGSVTLTGDTRIEMREKTGYDPHSNIISGAISGAGHILEFRNSASNAPGRILLNNAANTTKTLKIYGDGGTDAVCYVTLGATYTATESTSIGQDSVLIVNGANYLATPLVNLVASRAVLDVSAAGLTLAGGTTLSGVGTVNGNVAAGAGANVAPGVTVITTEEEVTTITNNVGALTVTGNLDMSGGGNMTWQLGALVDDALLGVAGTDFDFATVTGDLTLGGTSQLTLDLSLVGNPATSETFWTTGHSWKIIDGGVTTGDFASLVNGTFSAGYFETSVVDNDVFLSFTADPQPMVPGDTNGDGYVDATDAAVLAGNWGATVAQGDATAGDFNDDGVVNAADAAILAANWNPAPPPSEAAGVPEPSAIVALLSALVGTLFMRRRK